ncbi:conserved Plasmodium protein, unknown function [Plasmodium vinckei]|uniref:Uncharacterized protein n=2 Tax=Plasmodium vinckei TaxID=5860 RepID=A0A6V7SDD6_PLAVN|nr:conserved Plasmodium protein, unknown function [Plasmodium vinckei petteri]CAD2095625.1 conserved Plasmodium protein, unknown function [Plasmodium vinckei]
MEYLSHPPPEPDFWIYFASYLRNGWMQVKLDKYNYFFNNWALVFIPFFLLAFYLKFTMPSYGQDEKSK